MRLSFALTTLDHAPFFVEKNSDNLTRYTVGSFLEDGLATERHGPFGFAKHSLSTCRSTLPRSNFNMTLGNELLDLLARCCC